MHTLGNNAREDAPYFALHHASHLAPGTNRDRLAGCAEGPCGRREKALGSFTIYLTMYLNHGRRSRLDSVDLFTLGSPFNSSRALRDAFNSSPAPPTT